MLRFALLVTTLFVILSTSAQGLVMIGSDAQERRWVSKLTTPLPDATVVITKYDQPCSKPAVACALDNITRYPDGSVTHDYEIRIGPKTHKHEFIHELGHIYDFVNLTNEQRDRFRMIRHIGRQWDEGKYPADEQSAEAYSQCNQVTENRGYKYHPTLAQHLKICKLINGS